MALHGPPLPNLEIQTTQYCESSLVASSVVPNAIHSTRNSNLCVISDGHELQDNRQIGARHQVLSQLAGVGQGAHVLSAVVLSKLCGRSNTRRAQKTLKGKQYVAAGLGGGEEGRRGEVAFFPLQSHFYSVQSYPQLGRFMKPFWLSHQACSLAEEHRLYTWQCRYQGLENDSEHLFPVFPHLVGKREEETAVLCINIKDGAWVGMGASSLVTLKSTILSSQQARQFRSLAQESC